MSKSKASSKVRVAFLGTGGFMGCHADRLKNHPDAQNHPDAPERPRRRRRLAGQPALGTRAGTRAHVRPAPRRTGQLLYPESRQRHPGPTGHDGATRHEGDPGH